MWVSNESVRFTPQTKSIPERNDTEKGRHSAAPCSSKEMLLFYVIISRNLYILYRYGRIFLALVLFFVDFLGNEHRFLGELAVHAVSNFCHELKSPFQDLHLV